MQDAATVYSVRLVWRLLSELENEKPHRYGDQIHLNSFFPPYPSAAFHRFCSLIVSERRAPHSTYLAVTSDCPFDCSHCSHGQRERSAMPGEVLLGLIADIKALGGHTLGITGGEPLLRDDLEEVIAAAGPDMATIVFTTGWRLTRERARRLRDAGLTILTIGLDAADAARHDQIRGRQGAFDQAHEAVRICHEVGQYTAISAMPDRERLQDGELERLYELATEWGVGELRINCPVATGSMVGCSDKMFTPDELEQLKDFHRRCNRESDGPAVASLALIESEEFFGCGAGLHHLFIDAAGNVCPCDLTPLSFGNINDRPLADIWDEMGEHFEQPRGQCLMRHFAGELESNQILPIAPSQSQQLCEHCDVEPIVPGIYRRLREVRAEMEAEGDLP